MSVIESVISNNRLGGGIYGQSVELTNSTVSGNVEGDSSTYAPTLGAGVTAKALTLSNSTIARNQAENGAAVVVRESATLSSSIVAENVGGDLLAIDSGAFTSGGNNLIGDGSGGGAFVNGVKGDVVGTAARPVDPRLGPLALNGGPTATHALLPGPPAIDAGSNPLDLETDQRGEGFPRDLGAAPDIGAFESAPTPILLGRETDRNSAFAIRDRFEAPDGAIIAAALRPDGSDRDFFEFSGFAPGSAVVLEVTEGDLDTTLGLFDRSGRRVAIDDDAGAGDLSRLLAIADDQGAVRVAVSGFDDFDFDGRSDSTGRPHGQSGDYVLTATPAETTRAVVQSKRDDAEQDGPAFGVQLDGTVLTTGDRPGKTAGVRFSGLDTPEGAEILDAYMLFEASSRIKGGGALKIELQDSRAAEQFGWFGEQKILSRDYLEETATWRTEDVRFGDSFRTPNLAPLLDALLGGDDVDPSDSFVFKLTGPGRIDAWSVDGRGDAPELVIVYATPSAPPDGLDPFGLG